MAAIQAHKVESYLASPDPRHRTILFYGPNRGLVSERAETFAKSLKIDISDPFATVRLDADEAASDRNRIADEAHTVSMFGDERLIWIKGSTQKNLINALQPVLDTPPEKAFIVIEAGDLGRTAFRSRIEKAATAVALPCFGDSPQALSQMVDQECAAHGLSIAPDAKAALLQCLGADRLASRGEIQKLCLYSLHKGTIQPEDIEAIVGDASELNLDTVFDAAMLGKITDVEDTLARLSVKGTNLVPIHIMMVRNLQNLHAVKCQMMAARRQASDVVNGLRPPIHFKRKAAFTTIVSKWPLDAIEKVQARLNAIASRVRSQSSLETDVLAMAILAISVEARRHIR